MAYTKRVDQWKENNKVFAENWQSPVTMVQMRAASKGNKNGIIVLTCLDPRCVPEMFFGPDLRAGVIRNAGGRANYDALRSILALRSLADTQAVLVVHHTDCGVTHLTNKQIASEARERTPSDKAAREIEVIENAHLGFGCLTADEYEQAIRDDVKWLRDRDSLKGVDVIGMSFDLDTGLVSEVE